MPIWSILGDKINAENSNKTPLRSHFFSTSADLLSWKTRQFCVIKSAAKARSFPLKIVALGGLEKCSVTDEKNITRVCLERLRERLEKLHRLLCKSN